MHPLRQRTWHSAQWSERTTHIRLSFVPVNLDPVDVLDYLLRVRVTVLCGRAVLPFVVRCAFVPPNVGVKHPDP